MENIKQKTESLLLNVDKAIEWAESNSDEIVRNGLKKPFKSIRRDLSVIQESLEKRPSIAIFGQSQVGKSYLVQNLAKPFGTKYLEIEIAKGIDNVNFLTEMNPIGGKESTGLVTRFTTNTIEEDKEYPFQIDFFTQLDIASIIVNAYWSDLQDYDASVYDIDKDELKNLWISLSEKQVQEGVTENEAYFFQQYITENFRDSILIRELSKLGYFNDIKEKLINIPFDKRWELLHYLWGRNEFLTQMFKRLSDGIRDLEYAKTGRVTLNALTPNSKTILDVERVREILDKENKDLLDIKLPNGKTVKILRSVLSVITKEVQLKLSAKFEENDPQSFLNHSDLLDFPGSKSREKMPLSVFNNNSAEEKLQLLIRGKVSYLFDNYSSKLGVSTLLYCMDDTPPEEKEAPNRLYKWVERYIGGSTDARTNRLIKTKEILKTVNNEVQEVSPLLVAFTKFNIELNKVLPGKETDLETHNSKWLARFGENFKEFMSRPVDDKWITNWTKDESNFKFIFPIRDPLYSQATFDGYDASEKETRIRPEREEAMRTMETSFTNTAIVNKHTLSSTTIWDEISSPNGTGIMYLSKNLKNSAHPIVTETRLNLELDRIQSELLDVLVPYQVSGNLTKDLEIAKRNGALAYTSLIKLANIKDNPLSNILTQFVINDTDLWNLLYDVVFGNEGIESEDEGSSNDINIIESFKDIGINFSPEITKEDVWDQLIEIYSGLGKEDIQEIIQDAFGIKIGDLEHLISPKETSSKAENKMASIIISHWTEKLMGIALDDKIFRNIEVRDQEIFRGIIAEIIKARERFNLNQIISDFIKDIKSGAISAEDIDLVASTSVSILNKFMYSAGWSFAKEEEKPEVFQSKLEIFSDFGQNASKELDYSQNKNKYFFSKWSLGVKELYEENVRFHYNLGGKEVNSKLNEKLDSIIEDLKV